MKKIIFALATTTALGFSTSALACTTIIVGSKVSKTGKIIVARNVDADGPQNSVHLVIHPAETYGANSYYHSIYDQFRYPNPIHSLRYIGAPEYFANKGKAFEESGFNQAGVAVSATETIYASKKVLAIDPYIKTGIDEASITSVILRRAHSAKDGVALLGHIIDTHGAAEGFGVAIADKHGAWYFENAGGHEWVAEKIPANSYFVAANQTRLQEVNLNDKTNVMHSKNLLSFAIKHHLYNPKQGPFNFRLAYSSITKGDITYNYMRLKTLQAIFNPSRKNVDYKLGKFPDFLKPAHPISVTDVRKALQNHYQGTANDPYNTANPIEKFRPISVFRAAQSHILTIDPKLPRAIGDCEYLALGMTALTPYVPFYNGMTYVPTPYTIQTPVADDASATWIYRKLQTLAMGDFAEYAPIVQSSQNELMQNMASEQQRLIGQYLRLYKKHPAEAQHLIQQFENHVTQQSLANAKKLTNTLFGLQAAKVDKDYLFEGA